QCGVKSPPQQTCSDDKTLHLYSLLMTNTFQRAVDGMAEPVDDHIDIFRRRDIGRREQDVIPPPAVPRYRTRVATKPAFEGCGLDPQIELERGIERRARGAVGDPFHRPEQAAPTGGAHTPGIAEH